jgi:hypothetical protein
MKTLIVKDQIVSEELDHAAMAAKHGGMKKLSAQRASVNESRGLGPAIEFLIARFGFAMASGLITYALYRMFLL